MLALIAGELVTYWDQSEVSSYVAGELSNYQTSSQVSSAISSALSSYDDSGQVDSKIITALLDFYTRAETDQAIADAVTSGTDLSNYYSISETQSYVANELLAFYPRTELDSQLTATFTQYWTSGRTQTEIDDAIAGAGFLDQTAGDARYFVRAPGAESGQIFNVVQEQFTPRIVRNLLLEAPLVGDAILGNQSTLRIRSDTWSKAEADARFLRTNDLGPLDARYFVTTPGAEGSGIFNLAQTQFVPNIIRNLLCQTPLSCQPILGNGSTLQISCDCWSKNQSDTRYPLIANFNSLGQRVTDLENSPGVDPTADLTVNSLTATAFVQTPLLQSAAADLQMRNATTTIRAEDGTLLASFAAGNIGLEQDITVRSDRTLNATTADVAQFFVGSTAATGTFTSSSSVTATQEITSDLRVQAPLVRCDPAATVLTIQGGTNGVLVDDTLRINGALAPEASLPFLTLSGGSSGVQVLSPLLEQIAVGPTDGTVGMVIRNAATTGEAAVLLDANNQAGVAELKVRAGGNCELNALFQFISFNTTNGLANLAIEPNIGGSNDGEVIFGYGFVNLSDRSLKENVRAIPEEELQQTFDAVEPQLYDRIGAGKDQIGFVAQDVQASGKLGATMCKTKNLDGRELMALDYQKLSVVLWGIVKKLQKRVEKLENKKTAGEFPERRDLTSARAQAALRSDVARQVLAPKPRSLGQSAAEGPNDRLQADLVDFSQNTRGANKYGLVVTDVFTREVATKALPDKRAETVTQAAAEIIPDLVQDEGNYVVTTDQGNEFQGLERALPGGVVHRQKDPSDRNATAVVDRAIQTLKKDLAGEVARHGGGWGEHVENVTEAYNARPHQAVHAAPEDVETQPATTFRVYQDNAAKFQHNKELTEGRKRRLEEAGAFRAPTNARRSFEPQYGPARDVAGIDSMVVRATDGTETLLKHALPVPRGSAEPKAKLTRPPVPLAIRQLRDFNLGPVAPP